MEKKILLFILLLNLVFCNKNWTDYNNQLISSTSVVLMFSNDIAPKLGLENPLNISDIPNMESLVGEYGIATLNPLFSSYKSFNQGHYDFQLHQYYKLNFNRPIDIISLVNQLEKITILEKIELNYIVKMNITPNDQYYASQWAHDNNGQAISNNGNNVGTLDCDTDTNQAWDITTGEEDVVIAILDTGVNEHSEFSGRLLNGYDFINNDSNAADDNGHGTACAGIAAARGNNAQGIAGVCWDCSILPVKILSFDGYGEDIQIADGLQWSADNGADIISMSLGGGAYVSYFNNAINYANSVGVMVFAASGNDNSGNLSYPSAYDNCLSVGALSPCNERKSPSSCDGENYWGSNYGDGLNFLAPGVRIHTTNSSGNYTSTFNGTSSACPHAAGIAGLILSADQSLSPESVKIIMEESSDDLGSDGYDIQTGHGRLNAFNALTMIVAGPVIDLDVESLDVTLNVEEVFTEQITIYNNGEMDLNYFIDPYGYQYDNSDNNNINYTWIDISDNYETISFAHNDDASSQIIPIDFDFLFYNNFYSSFIVSPNGWIGFGEDNSEWLNTGLPNVNAPLNAIMPFWDDLNPNNTANSNNMSGDVKYQSTNDKTVIWYDNVRHWVGSGDIDGTYDFQIVLHQNGNIDFNYRSMVGDVNSATIGIQDETGTNAITIAVNNNLVHSELSININPRPSWLDISPNFNSIIPGQSDNIFVQFNSTSLTEGTVEYVLNIQSNDFQNPNIMLPIALTINNLPCDGQEIGDLNNDGDFNVLDIVLIVNIILYSDSDECQIFLSDLNTDYSIDVLDIVLLINLILR